ncbi:MAG: glycosyltransferase family 39 protein [Thermoanaerobaculia bacterium]
MRRRELAIVTLAVLLFFWFLGGHDLWAPDEPYFAEGAREMLADGEWVVPHVNGRVTTDKPPLFFWSIALASMPGGRVTPWTARAPSALAAIVTLLLILRLARRAGEPRIAWLAGGVLATTLMFWEKARWAQTDSLLCALVWVALSAFLAYRTGEADGRRAGLVFWAALALAVLDKGPVGLLLPLGIALVTLAVDRDLGAWRRFAPLSGPLLFLLVAGLWPLAIHLWGAGDYSLWGALKEHFIERGLHGMHHKRPFWYYLRVLPVHLLPWSGLVPGAVVLAWRRRDPWDRFLLVVCGFVVLFFSISTEKRDLYVLPAVPAFALLVARFIATLAEEGPTGTRPVRRRWLFAGQTVVAGLLLLAGLAVPFAARGRTEVPYWMPLALAALLVICSASALVACRRRRVLPAALGPAVAFVAAYLFVTAVAFPAMESSKSARSFSSVLRDATAASREAGHEVLAYDLSNLPEAFAFYSDGVYTRETEDPQVLVEHLEQEATVWAAMDAGGLETLPEQVRASLVVVERTELSRKDVLLVRNR